MRRSISKRAWSAVLALAIVFTALFSNVVTAKAETKYESLLADTYGVATAGVETQQYSFTADKAYGVMDFGVTVYNPVGVTFKIYEGGVLIQSEKIEKTDAYWYGPVDGVYLNDVLYNNVPAGDYAVSLVFDESVEYKVWVDVGVPEASLSQEKASITVGYTKKLSVSNGTVKKWSSKNSKIATVDAKGKVTAKKAGTTTIVATLDDGTQLTCKVTVKENKYKETKYTTNDVAYNAYGMHVYEASFNSKGDLVLKVNIVNNSYHKIVELRNVKITVKDENGKVVGTYKASKKNITVPAYSTKTTSFTIKKSALKKKKADLRLGKATVSESTSAWYYTYN